MVKILKGILTLLMVFTVMYLMLLMMADHQRIINTPWATLRGTEAIPKEEIMKLHKYHGILISKADEKGWYFIRDGKRCPLFKGNKRNT